MHLIHVSQRTFNLFDNSSMRCSIVFLVVSSFENIDKGVRWKKPIGKVSI